MEKNNLLRNIGFAWKKAKQHEGIKFYAYSIIFIIVSVITPFLTMALPSAVIWLLEKNIYFSKAILFVLGYTAILLLLNILVKSLHAKIKFYNLSFRMKMGYEIDNKILDTDFVNVDSQEKKNNIEKAFATLFHGDEEGIAGLLLGLIQLAINVLCLIVYLMLVTRLNYLIMLLLLISPIISIYGNIINIKWINKNKDTWTKYDLKFNYLKTQSIDLKNAKDIRLYNIKDWFTNLFGSITELRLNWYNKEYRRTLIVQIIDRIVFCAQTSIVYGYLFYQLINGMELSSFVLYLGVISGVSGFIKTAFNELSGMIRKNVSVNDYITFMNTEEHTNRGAGLSLPNNKTHEIRLENVTFRYPDTNEILFDNVSLTIKRGEKLAIVGANGAGKTTFIKLLCGLYTPDSGDIYIDGINTKDLNIYDYFNRFSVVFQDVFVFAYTIAQNIACSNTNIDYDKIYACLELAGIKDKINSLPKKADTNMLKEFDDDGILLSGGEMQKLMLARALYKNSPIIILDEPTAALDPIAESEMYEKYNTLINDKTSIFISHRLSSTRFCDRILFMNHGKFIESGSHDELIKLNGEYAKMYEIQAHYYQKEIEENA